MKGQWIGAYAAFLNLVQHHGFPTPLLDWTFSPFIAAYFAYKGARAVRGKKVRVFVFDISIWHRDWERSQVLLPGNFHLTTLEPLSINNPRAGPQQSLTSVTNVDDVETYIGVQELRTKRTYLRAIDLPAIERKHALAELALMGISAGSLFPGLDGMCGQLRERYYDFG
jgi:hypothetical protein